MLNTAACKTDVDLSYDTAIDHLTGSRIDFSQTRGGRTEKTRTQLFDAVKHIEQVQSVAGKLLARKIHLICRNFDREKLGQRAE